MFFFHLTPCRFLFFVSSLPTAFLYHVVEVARVELGELVCDSLTDVPDSTLLRFVISSNEVRGEDQGCLADHVHSSPLKCERYPNLACSGTQQIGSRR